MSKIAIKGNESGTATFTIEAPATNTDRIFELPDEAGKVLTDVSDIEPQVKTATNASGSAPIYACRAWVNFNGHAGASVRASGNVSSVVRTGTGQYTINFTTAMPDANYSIAGQYRALNAGDPGIVAQFGALSVGSFSILAGLRTTSPFESPTMDTITLSVFR